MTCAGAETWLLTARAARALPNPVQAHLAECRGCARRLAALTRTDAAVRGLAPDPNSAARQRLARAIERTPQSVPPTVPKTPVPAGPSRRVPRWVLGGAAGLAVALLLTVGWLAGRAHPKATAQVPASSAPAEAPTGPGRTGPAVSAPSVGSAATDPVLPAGLSARVARHSARIAADPTPGAQTEALENLAADVRAEVVRRAGAGDADALPRLTGLHERVLKLGLARQIARTPPDQRRAAAERLADRLKAAGDGVTAAAARFSPVLGDLVEPLSAACRETAEGLRNGKQPEPSDWPAPPTPLEAVTVHALRVAGADDALARANESAQLATALSRLATVLSAAGQSDDAGRVGDAIATVLDAGVANNLERVESADPGGALVREVTLVREQADRAIEPLESEAARDDPVAKPGLEKALVASAPGHARATGKPPKHVPPPARKKP